MQAIRSNTRNAKHLVAKPALVVVLVFTVVGAASGLVIEHVRRSQAGEAVTFLPQLQVIMGRQYLEAGRYGSGGQCAEAMPVSPDLNFEYSCVTGHDGMSYRIRAAGKSDALTVGLEYVIDDAGLRSARCDTCDWRVADATRYWLAARP